MSDAVQFIRSGNGLRLSYAQRGECWPAVGASSSVAREGSFVKRRSRKFGDVLRRKAPLDECRRGVDVFATGGDRDDTRVQFQNGLEDRAGRFSAVRNVRLCRADLLGDTILCFAELPP
jgi:hypothetical protein